MAPKPDLKSATQVAAVVSSSLMARMLTLNAERPAALEAKDRGELEAWSKSASDLLVEGEGELKKLTVRVAELEAKPAAGKTVIPASTLAKAQAAAAVGIDEAEVFAFKDYPDRIVVTTVDARKLSAPK